VKNEKDLVWYNMIIDGRVKVMKDDLYKSIKEVAELKYRILEVETKLNNLTSTVKILTGRGL